MRPTLREYIRSTWQRRDFARTLATSNAIAENQNSYLGQIWAVLTPLMNAFVYVLIFGLILKITRGQENGVGFIVVGTFMYRFFSESASGGAKSVQKNLNLVRALHFPRSLLPISTVMSNLASLVPAIFVMCVIVALSGFLPPVTFGGVDWEWLLIVPAVALLYVFNLGVAFILARVVERIPDLGNLLPFVLRVLLYASGVIFAIDRYIPNETLAAVMGYQPVAVYLNLARQALLNEPNIPLDGTMWLFGLGWAVLAFVLGFIFFWRAEARYGRE
ncbi:MAG: ABC transporter permease [Myxococcales bacterium]|nr:ABC transporter permease [Myxococcales bacterium]